MVHHQDARTNRWLWFRPPAGLIGLVGLVGLVGFVAIALGVVTSPPAGAAVPNYAVYTWTTRDGLPQNSVLDIAQTPDGLLWLATRGGLVRFDGSAFAVEDVSNSPALATSRLERLALGPRGELFLGTSDGRVLRRTERSDWLEVPLEGACGERIVGIEFGDDGTLWVATHCSLLRVPPGQERGVIVVQGEVRCLAVGAGGGVYYGTKEGVLRVQGDQATLVRPDQVGNLAVGPDGTLYASSGSEIIRYTVAGWERLPIEIGLVGDLYFDEHDRLWMVGATGLGWWDVFESAWSIVDAPEILARGQQVVSLCLDRESNLWLGCESDGLMKLAPSPLFALIPEGVGEDRMGSVAVTVDGRVFGCGELLWEVVDGGLVPYPAPWPSALAAAATGGLWIATDRGVERWIDGELETVLEKSQLPPGNGALLESRRGPLWIARGGTLLSWDGATLDRVEIWPTTAKEEFNTLFEDRGGRLWIGGLSGLCVWDGETHWDLRAGHELPMGEVRAFHEAQDGAVWVGTYGGGIYRIVDRDIRVINTSHGLFEDIASALVQDGAGRMVVVGNRAITTYRMADLEAVAEGASKMLWGRAFDAGLNIEAFEANGVFQPRAVLDDSGLIWMPTLHGIAAFDPSRVTAVPPPDSRVVFRGAEPPFQRPDGGVTHTLASGVRDVRVEFSATSFVEPRQVHFRYRLSGREQWQQISSGSIVQYDGLPPGEYTFEVEAANADGPFGPRNSETRFVISPTWLERRMVKELLALLSSAVIVVWVLLRVRRTHLRSVALEKVVQERTRTLSNEVRVRERAEEELRRVGQGLEAEVARRTAELAHALRRLELDVEQRERLEGRLREAEKLEVVGRLAGGLAHDFNNILTAVLGESDLALMELENARFARGDGPTTTPSESINTTLHHHLVNVRDAGSRAARLTRQLLAYSRQQVMQPAVVDPLSTMEELRAMLVRLVPDNVALSIREGARSQPVLIDPGQLEQVIVNLVVNAAEALPDGGEIELHCEVVPMDDGRQGTAISVSDDGVGLSDECRAKIFEPFYSTKGAERGLGLASVQGIVLQSGGTLRVQSELGHGTTFWVTFPVTTGSLRSASPVARPNGVEGLTVLLTDDQEDVRRVARLMLERAGVRVIEAPTPASAILLAKKHRDEIDILVTDVVMPKMGGKELSVEVRKVCPTIGVLFVSGYFAEELSARELLGDGANFLMKPFDGRTLIARIAELVSAQHSVGD